MNSNIRFSVRYKMNFTPKLTNLKVSTSKIKLNKVYCKNFLFTMLALELFNEHFKSNLSFTKIKIHIIKKRKHIGSILRAPYKCKSAQFSIGFYRYFLTLNFIFKSNFKLKIFNKNEFINYIFKLLNSYNYFESTLVTQVSRSVKIPTIIII